MRILVAIAGWTLIEIGLFVVIGARIGVFWSWAVVLATAAAGMALIRWQGGRAVQSLRGNPGAARDLAAPLGHAALIVLAAVLLILPGFMGDMIGLVLLVPLVREVLLGEISRRARVAATGRQVRGMFQPGRSEIVDVQAEDLTPAANRPQQPSGWTKP